LVILGKKSRSTVSNELILSVGLNHAMARDQGLRQGGANFFFFFFLVSVVGDE
jgi:hypothetical protein